MAALAVVHGTPETVSGLSRRLAELLEQSESEGVQGQLPDATREQATGLVEALRRRIVRKPDRDHRSLFDLDDRLIELMGLVEEAADDGGEISKELAQEIDTYLEAYRLKVDRIVGYWRWQQSIADISSKETERLAARKKEAENRVTRLKELEHHVGRAGYSQVGRSDLLTFPAHPLQLAGVVFTIALLALAWASRGRLTSMGFEFLHWNRTSAREDAEALAFGAVC